MVHSIALKESNLLLERGLSLLPRLGLLNVLSPPRPSPSPGSSSDTSLACPYPYSPAVMGLSIALAQRTLIQVPMPQVSTFPGDPRSSYFNPRSPLPTYNLSFHSKVL